MNYGHCTNYELSDEEHETVDNMAVAFATGMFLKVKTETGKLPTISSVVSVISMFLIAAFDALEGMKVYQKFVPEGCNVSRSFAKSVLSSVARHMGIDLRELAAASESAARNVRPQDPGLN